MMTIERINTDLSEFLIRRLTMKRLLITSTLSIIILLLFTITSTAQNGRNNQFKHRCQYGFVDADGDGICDNIINKDAPKIRQRLRDGSGQGHGYGNRNGNGDCDGFIDEDGDGVCDNCDGSGECDGTGPKGGRHKDGRRKGDGSGRSGG